jgi:hypothetical protein
MAVLGGLNSSYERMTVLHLSADGQSLTTADVSGSNTNADAFFQSFNKRLRNLYILMPLELISIVIFTQIFY